MLSTAISELSGVVAIVTAVWSVHARRVRRETARADKWRAVVESLTATNDDLREQIRDLRTVALVDERLRAHLPKGTDPC